MKPSRRFGIILVLPVLVQIPFIHFSPKSVSFKQTTNKRIEIIRGIHSRGKRDCIGRRNNKATTETSENKRMKERKRRKWGEDKEGRRGRKDEMENGFFPSRPSKSGKIPSDGKPKRERGEREGEGNKEGRGGIGKGGGKKGGGKSRYLAECRVFE